MSRSQRTTAIIRAIVVTFVINLAVAMTKISVGLLTGLLSVTASGFESLLDTTNNVIGFTAMRQAKRAPDADHPYGHRKYETFAALVVAFMMFLAGTHIFLAAMNRFREGFTPQTGFWPFAAMGVSMLANLFVIKYEGSLGRKHKSEFLTADAAHTATDFLSSAIVLIAIFCVSLGVPWADLAAACVVVLVIVWVGFRLIRGTFSILVDSAQLDPQVIADCALRVDGIYSVHNVRSRGTPDAVAVDLHVKVKPDLTVEEGHRLSHSVKDCISRELPEVVDVVIHIEPFGQE